MKRLREVAKELATVICLLFVMLAAICVGVGLDRHRNAQARVRADAYSSGNNWTLIKTERGKQGDYYVVHARSDDEAVGDVKMIVFPDDETGSALLNLREHDRFAFRRTDGRSFRARALEINYLAVAPAG
jgi:hypothetical protein